MKLKFITILTTIIILGILLTGCSQNTAQTDPSSTQAPTTHTTQNQELYENLPDGYDPKEHESASNRNLPNKMDVDLTDINVRLAIQNENGVKITEFQPVDENTGKRDANPNVKARFEIDGKYDSIMDLIDHFGGGYAGQSVLTYGTLTITGKGSAGYLDWILDALDTPDLYESPLWATRTLIIQNGITELKTDLMPFETRIETIQLPDTLEIIQDSAIRCAALSELTLPASLAYLGHDNFNNLYGPDVYQDSTLTILCKEDVVLENGFLDQAIHERTIDGPSQLHIKAPSSYTAVRQIIDDYNKIFNYEVIIFEPLD